MYLGPVLLQLLTYFRGGVGDFNVILDESLDYMGPSTPSKTHFTSKIEILLRKHNIVDIWRKTHPELKQYTL